MENAISIAFILWISFCLVMFCLKADYQKNFVKFIGGFTVALLAVHANNSYIYFLSIAITGLIIASERFMSVLVALVRGSDTWKNENFLKTLEKMSPDEIKSKAKLDVEEIKETIKDDIKLNRSEITKSEKVLKIYSTNALEIEDKALTKFEKGSDLLLKRNVKFGRLLLDAIASNKKGSKVYFFEVKVIPDTNKRATDKDLAAKINHLLRRTIPNLLLSIRNETAHLEKVGFASLILMIIIVVDSDRNLDIVSHEVAAMSTAYNDSQNNITVRFSFYNSVKLS